MDSRLFETNLCNHKIFKDLKIEETGKLQNLMELKDDVLYVWNHCENCLFCLNLQRLEEYEGDTPYQKLHLLSPPAFSVERVVASGCGSRLCVWGPRGVSVAELPTRWGRGGLFDSGAQTVLCKSHNLDERFLYSQSEVRRVQWHPSSLAHLLLLVSDNTIRLYNIALKSGPKVVKVISIGPKPASILAGRTILDSLGDTAVDFTPTPDAEYLLILRGNGDVYMMPSAIEGKSHTPTPVRGPLPMYPPADDNYGSESCAITAMGGVAGSPALIVVATCSAELYHCLLLPNSSDKEEEDTHSLYVVEEVELNTMLSTDSQMHHSYPVLLHPCSSSTYACVHAGGLHTVTLPILDHLKDYALADEGDWETVLSAMCSRPSVARHSVCTEASGRTPRPPPGLVARAAPLPRLLLLPGAGPLLARTLEPYELEEQLYKEIQLKNPALDQDDLDKLLKERQKLSFTNIIQEILTRDISQPILKLNKSEEPELKETLEFLTQATVKLRGEYMLRQQRASDAAQRKLAALRSLRDHHALWLRDLKRDLEEIRLQNATLSDKCALADKHQEDIKYRCSGVVRRQRASCATTAAERELLVELRNYREMGDRLKHQITQLQHHAKDRRDDMAKWRQEYKKKDIALGKSHSDTISSILQQQTNQISTLIEEIKLLKDQLSIV